MSEFFDSFNGALPDMESNFSEKWTYNGSTFPAIAIDKLTVADKAARGGKFIEATTQIFVREKVFTASGVSKSAIISARGQDFSIIEIDQEGDASRTLICGPAGIDVWR